MHTQIELKTSNQKPKLGVVTILWWPETRIYKTTQRVIRSNYFRRLLNRDLSKDSLY